MSKAGKGKGAKMNSKIKGGSYEKSIVSTW